MSGLQIFPARPVIPGWAKVALTAVAVVALALLVMNKLDQLTAWWPWSDESKLERSESARVAAQMTAIADRLTAEAATQQVERIETHTREVITLRETAAQVAEEARSAPDADIPLDDGLADRLHADQQRLCGLYPPACGPAEGEPAAGGD